MNSLIGNLPELHTKPDFETAMQRIYAWYEQAVIDRPPIRFTAHNADFNVAHVRAGRDWPDLRSRWFDAEYQVDYHLASIQGQSYLAETFPVFWPNLGPEVFAAFFGAELIYGEVTSWSKPLIEDWRRMDQLKLDWHSTYMQKLEELTRIALEKSQGRYLTGYTDLHGGRSAIAL